GNLPERALPAGPESSIALARRAPDGCGAGQGCSGNYRTLPIRAICQDFLLPLSYFACMRRMARLPTGRRAAGKTRRNDADCCRTARSRFCPQGSKPAGSEAFRLQGQEKCGPGFLSARLEPDLHERARLLRERLEAVRATRRTGTRPERGQRLVAQGLGGEDGHPLPVAR